MHLIGRRIILMGASRRGSLWRYETNHFPIWTIHTITGFSNDIVVKCGWSQFFTHECVLLPAVFDGIHREKEFTHIEKLNGRLRFISANSHNVIHHRQEFLNNLVKLSQINRR